MSLRDLLAEALARAAVVERELLEPKTLRDSRLLASLGREHQRLVQVVERAALLHKYDDELAQTRELVGADDPEMAAEARAEEGRLTADIVKIEAELKPLLLPRDPLDDRNCIVEIRAGTGGDEAALFAAELWRMYTRYIERKGW
ncbi:MAG TPA: PCRF domain-containing protein, partial [Gemmatimonadaceae bacterium]|nr:PCRF domain-containing protein [Gemmatimonadaceae bacterium]